MTLKVCQNLAATLFLTGSAASPVTTSPGSASCDDVAGVGRPPPLFPSVLGGPSLRLDLSWWTEREAEGTSAAWPVPVFAGGGLLMGSRLVSLVEDRVPPCVLAQERMRSGRLGWVEVSFIEWVLFGKRLDDDENGWCGGGGGSGMEVEMEMEMGMAVAVVGGNQNRVDAYMRCPQRTWKWELVARGRQATSPGPLFFFQMRSPGHWTVGSQGRSWKERGKPGNYLSPCTTFDGERGTYLLRSRFIATWPSFPSSLLFSVLGPVSEPPTFNPRPSSAMLCNGQSVGMGHHKPTASSFGLPFFLVTLAHRFLGGILQGINQAHRSHPLPDHRGINHC